MNSTNASLAYIDILAVIDTERIREEYTNPSKDPNYPTGVDKKNLYMIGSDPRGIKSGQGTSNLNFKANPGDIVHFKGVSVQQNSYDTIILYKIQCIGGDRIFNNIGSGVITRNKALSPGPDSLAGIPAVNSKVSFVNHHTVVISRGTANLYLSFALYTLEDDGMTQKLYGYFYCDTDITTS